MPDARSRRGRDATDRLDGPPYRVARRLDAQARSVFAAPRPALSEAELRQIKRAQRIELRRFEARPKILSGLPHADRDRAPAFHDGERIEGTIGPRCIAL